MKSCETCGGMILVADDDITVRSLIRAILEGAGHRVIEAHDGEDAVAKFIANRRDIRLLVLDVKMPGKTGPEAYAEILKLEPRIKAVFVSGYGGDSGIDLSDMIAKPFVPQDLLHRLAPMLN